jgi:hypothetical protein
LNTEHGGLTSLDNNKGTKQFSTAPAIIRFILLWSFKQAQSL